MKCQGTGQLAIVGFAVAKIKVDRYGCVGEGRAITGAGTEVIPTGENCDH